MFDLHTKNCVITGGGSGIGEAIASLFARQGGNVFIVDINIDLATKVSMSLRSNDLSVQALACDISDEASVHKCFQAIKTTAGSIDILVNSAGIAQIGNIENTTAADLEKIFNVNVKGTFNCMKAAIGMMAGRGGVLLNIASIASSVGIKDRLGYSMSKGAVLAMTLSVARDYVNQGIRCNCISPARVHTPFVDGFLKKNYPGKEEEMFRTLSESQPIGRMGKPEEIAALALYLCSDEAAFVTGCDYLIDGGFTRINN